MQKGHESVTHALSAGTNQDSVKYKFYLKYFKENVVLRFGRPQVDTCSAHEECQTRICSPHLAKSLKQVAVAELMIHRQTTKKFYKKLGEVTEK
jgi:hypothetical protein